PGAPTRGEGLWDEEADDGWDAAVSIFRNYGIKLEAERQARLAGRIAEADFCLRQVTFLEVAIDLASGDLFAFFRDMRRVGQPIIDIAETDASRILDDLRRVHFEECG